MVLRRSALIVCGLAWLGTAGALTAAEPDQGRQVYEKANCVGCHKWHGGGGGGYGGAALSLRATELDHAALIEVVRCGRPATRMPYHERGAYQTSECYGGLTKADLGADFPAKAAVFLREQEIEAVVDYVESTLQGKARADARRLHRVLGRRLCANAARCAEPARCRAASAGASADPRPVKAWRERAMRGPLPAPGYEMLPVRARTRRASRTAAPSRALRCRRRTTSARRRRARPAPRRTACRRRCS